MLPSETWAWTGDTEVRTAAKMRFSKIVRRIRRGERYLDVEVNRNSRIQPRRDAVPTVRPRIFQSIVILRRRNNRGFPSGSDFVPANEQAISCYRGSRKIHRRDYLPRHRGQG